jgi:hypothetical protein
MNRLDLLSNVFIPHSMLLKILSFALYASPLSVQALQTDHAYFTCYNGSLVTWTVISLTTAKFKPLIFSVTTNGLVSSLHRLGRRCTENTASNSSIFACVSVAADTCLSSCYQTMSLVFIHHVTISVNFASYHECQIEIDVMFMISRHVCNEIR